MAEVKLCYSFLQTINDPSIVKPGRRWRLQLFKQPWVGNDFDDHGRLDWRVYYLGGE